MRDDLDLSRPIECDVAIAGAGLSGLIAGAIAARRGLRVAVVDRAPVAGGRAGGTRHRGYHLDLGHRDGGDVGDLQVGWRYGQLAAREAGVELPLCPVEPAVRVHQIAETAGAPALSIVDGHWGAKGFAEMATRAFGCPEALLPAFGGAVAQLAATPAAERRAAIPVPLAGWLCEHVSQPAVRRALLTMVSVIYCEHPERASTGRLMDFLAPRDELPSLVTAYVEGGMEGLVSPWVQAIEARGGQVLLGLEPREVLFCRDRAAGLLAVDGSHLALELRARHVVLAEPLWRALSLLPPERIDPELAALAGALEDEQADAVGWVAGLSRLPRLRSSGEPEHHIGWNRVLVGDERRYLGGFHLPSLAVGGVAPDGKHLLHALVGRWLRRDERVDWETSRSAVDRILTHLRDFYLDLDACIEWHAHQAVSRPALLAWYWAPLLRHGIRAPGVGGVYLASATFESDAGPIDICAHAGLEAAHAILEDGDLAR